VIILLIVMPLWAMCFNPNKYPHSATWKRSLRWPVWILVMILICLSSFHAMTGALDFMWPFNTSGWDVTPETDDGTR
jgi:hypothetical protein